MTNPRRRWLFTRVDDPDEYRPGRAEPIGCYRLGYGWTASDKYTHKDVATEPSPSLPTPTRRPRVRRRKTSTLADAIREDLQHSAVAATAPQADPLPPDPLPLRDLFPFLFNEEA